VIKNLAALGKTIFLTSHAMDEVEYLADRVAIIAAGRIVAEGTPSTLAGRQKAATVVKFQLPVHGPELPERLRQGATIAGANVEVATTDPTRTLYDLTSWAVQAHVSLDGLEVARPSLEDAYLEITHDAAAEVAKK